MLIWNEFLLSDDSADIIAAKFDELWQRTDVCDFEQGTKSSWFSVDI